MLRNPIFISILLLCSHFTSHGQDRSRFSQAKGQNVGNTQNIEVFNASEINTEGVEFSPVIYENALVFVSRKKNGIVDDKTGKTFFELFYAELDPNGIPIKALDFSSELNSKRHEGPVTFNKKGDKIYFTRSNSKNGITGSDKKGRVGLKIYEATRGIYDWENIIELPFNDDEYSCMHPALSPDGKKLFFSSNMPGGYGGMDLYFVENKGEKWSKPINLGSKINSTKNEVFPFMHESGTLFFTSDGHDGLGGLDIFMININDRRWGRVMNLGEPLNSNKDDLGIILDPKGTGGYFSSNRDKGKGGDDIYIFDAPNGVHGITQQQSIGIPITVYDNSQNKTLKGASIHIYEDTKKGLYGNTELYGLEVTGDDQQKKLALKKNRKPSETRIITDKEGKATLMLKSNHQYLIMVTKTGYETKEVNYTVPSGKLKESLATILEKKNCLTLSGKVLVTDRSIPIPSVTITIVNKCDQTEEVTRTDIKGEFTVCLKLGCDFEIKAERNGFSVAISHVSTKKIRGSRSLNITMQMKPASDLYIKPIQEGSVIVLDNIYYDFNKSAIRKGAAPDLDALARLMNEYPSLEIELGAHTDSQGTEKYNQKLSFKRAESAKQFLVNAGIEARRIRAFGYGEKFIRNKCLEGVECTDKEHQYNRRTEVRVIKIDKGSIKN